VIFRGKTRTVCRTNTIDVENVRSLLLSSFRAYIHYFQFTVLVEKREKMTQVIMRGYEKHTIEEKYGR
jgi:hypothetical protein